MLRTRELSMYQIHGFNFHLDGVSASLTDAQLPLSPADLVPTYWPDGYVAPFAGQILAVTARLSSAATTGTLTIGPTVNGTEKTDLTQTVTTGTTVRGSVLRDRIAFASSDLIGAEVTTSAGWDGTSAGLVVVVWCVLTLDGI